MTVKHNLREILDKRGLKQKYISGELGLHKNTVSDMVNGKLPTLENALKVAKLLELRIEDIWVIEE